MNRYTVEQRRNEIVIVRRVIEGDVIVLLRTVDK